MLKFPRSARARTLLTKFLVEILSASSFVIPLGRRLAANIWVRCPDLSRKSLKSYMERVVCLEVREIHFSLAVCVARNHRDDFIDTRRILNDRQFGLDSNR